MRHGTYIAIVALCGLVLPLAVAVNAAYLWRAGELMTIREIVRMQTEDDTCLYGTALHDDTPAYKYEAYKALKPDIVVLGSSRVLTARQSFFSGSFYNMGSTMRSAGLGREAVSFMLEHHTPKSVFIAIDPWWFADNFPYKDVKQGNAPTRFTFEKLLQPLSWIVSGKVTPDEFWDTLTQAPTSCRIGVQAMQNDDGFAIDGSHYYTGVITGQRPDEADISFGSEIEAIQEGRGHSLPSDALDEQSVAAFIEMVHELEAEGINVFVFLPPLSPTVVEAMRTSGHAYRYAKKLSDTLVTSGIPFLDLTDPSLTGSTDCEFVDGIHGGDVVAARTLRAIDNKLSSNNGMRMWLNRDAIDEMIKTSAGRATAKEAHVPEVDFLALGCEK